jgi:hypothetical protein
MTTDPSNPMANPGRRLAEARKLQRAKRLTDPLYLYLLRERFGTSVWWTDKPPSLTDRRIQQYLDRRDNQDDEEAS